MSEERPVVVRTSCRPAMDDYDEILDRVEKGDRSVLPRIREIFDEFPAMVEEVGDLSRMAKDGIFDMLGGDNLMIREAQERKLATFIEEVAGPNSTALERLLADQIALCWLHVRYIEIKYSHTDSYTLTEGEYYQRCIDRAQKRYLRAIKTLAQVRRLQLPAVQLNVAGHGGKQVNIAGQ